MTGYLNSGYAESLAEFGEPIKLPRSEGWILKRKIPGFPYFDAMGCYPLFSCHDWSRLESDIDELSEELVSLTLVTDPFGKYDIDKLKLTFPDLMKPFKEHFIVDLRQPLEEIVSAHHRYYARKALKSINVELCKDPKQFIDEWTALYNVLIKRHNISGINAFSKSSFSKQFNIPGLVMFRAKYDNYTVGAQLWFIQDKVGYNHLTAFNDIGYKVRASYALNWSALNYFADNLTWLDLGAGSGVSSDGTDGLSVFKRGWANNIRSVYLCGQILDKDKYDEISTMRDTGDTNYFPSYRKGEFE